MPSLRRAQLPFSRLWPRLTPVCSHTPCPSPLCAFACARSWEALEGELAVIGVHPSAWPLPLTLSGVREAEKNPLPQPIPALPAVKRGSGEGESAVSAAGAAFEASVRRLLGACCCHRFRVFLPTTCLSLPCTAARSAAASPWSSSNPAMPFFLSSTLP